MKFRLRKTQKRKRLKRNSIKLKKKGGNGFIVEFNGISVSGQSLDKSQTVSPPSVKFPLTGKLYTLIMWDSDVPPQSQPGWAHWIVTNLKSSNDIQNNQLLEYNGPSPPSGTHRYFFGLFEQQNTINPQQPERSMFDVNKFIKENNLSKVYEVYMKVSSL